MQNNPKMEIIHLFVEEMKGLGADAGIIIAGAIVFVLFLLVFCLARFVTDFSRELRLVNIEIERTVGAEREHYIRRRRRLWLSLLPFIRY